MCDNPSMKLLALLSLLFFFEELSADITDQRVNFNDVLELEVGDPDAVVRYGDVEQLFGELWLPNQPSRGLVVFVHGGCWLNHFDVRHSRPLAHALSENGFTVWSLEYRRLGDPGGGFPGTFEDIDLATSSLHKLSEHGVDADLITIAGHSAGGHLALWAAARFPDRFTGVVGLAAITDLEAYAAGDSPCEQAAVTLMGGTPNQQSLRYQAHSPGRMKIHPNTQLVQGKQDTIVPAFQTEALALNPERIKFTKGGHFDVIHPDTSDFGVMLRTIGDSFQ